MGHSIGVGVGGAGGWNALAWAAEQAEVTDARLVLLYVCPSGSPLDHPAAAPSPAEVELIDPPLARAYAATRARLGGQRVAMRVLAGHPSRWLVDASAGVQLLVIGEGGDGRTVRRVLRHARCPVVLVRPNSSSSSSAPLAGHVVIGLDGSPASETALDFAFAYAADHRLPVAAVHVSGTSRDDYFSDDVTLSTRFEAEPSALRLLTGETEHWASKCPATPIRRAVLHGPVAGALLRASAGARLLVVGDKRRGVIGRARTGDVPLTVAADAPCPVVVVPMDQHETDPL